MFSESPNDVPALLPFAVLPQQARKNPRKQFSKPNPHFILSLSPQSVIEEKMGALSPGLELRGEA